MKCPYCLRYKKTIPATTFCSGKCKDIFRKRFKTEYIRALKLKKRLRFYQGMAYEHRMTCKIYDDLVCELDNITKRIVDKVCNGTY